MIRDLVESFSDRHEFCSEVTEKVAGIVARRVVVNVNFLEWVADSAGEMGGLSNGSDGGDDDTVEMDPTCGLDLFYPERFANADHRTIVRPCLIGVIIGDRECLLKLAFLSVGLKKGRFLLDLNGLENLDFTRLADDCW